MKSAVTQAPDVGGAGRLLRTIWEAWMEIGKNYRGRGDGLGDTLQAYFVA